METEEDWQRWFDDDERFVLHYARMAPRRKLSCSVWA